MRLRRGAAESACRGGRVLHVPEKDAPVAAGRGEGVVGVRDGQGEDGVAVGGVALDWGRCDCCRVVLCCCGCGGGAAAGVTVGFRP